MKYLKAYIKAFATIALWLSVVLFAIQLLSGNDGIALYFFYVSALAGFAGPIDEAMK